MMVLLCVCEDYGNASQGFTLLQQAMETLKCLFKH